MFNRREYLPNRLCKLELAYKVGPIDMNNVGQIISANISNVCEVGGER